MNKIMFGRFASRSPDADSGALPKEEFWPDAFPASPVIMVAPDIPRNSRLLNPELITISPRIIRS
jgi:hypothetical protein